MNVLNRFLFDPPGGYNNTDKSRARVTLFFGTFFGALHLLVGGIGLLLPPASRQTLLFTSVAGLVINGLVIVLVQNTRLRMALFTFTLYLLTVTLSTIAYSGVESGYLMVLALPMIYVGLIYGTRGIIAAVLLFGAEFALVAYLQMAGQMGPALPSAASSALFDAIILLSIGSVLAAFISEQRRVNLYADKLVSQLRATAEVAQTTSTILELSDLLKRTVDYIRDRFAFYHVQIFLIDPDRHYANLVASTGEIGEALLQRGHRLAVGSQSIIGRVTLLGTPITALDTASDPVHRMNELLPQTRSELALPLIAGDQIIGALDVQSTRPNAFVQEDIDSLQILAAQVSIAIRNAQLFEDQKTALNENRRLFLEAEMNLREIQRLNQRLTGEAWEDYLRLRKSPIIGYTMQDDKLQADLAWTPSLIQASDKRRPVITTQGNKQIVAVPVELRGKAIGAIEVETSEGVQQADLLEMVQSVAQRLALSIDNARLFEQAQELAQQELEVNAISAKMQAVTEVDDMMRTVLAELSRALGAEQGAIRLGIGLGEPSGNLTNAPTNPGARAANGTSTNGQSNGKAHP